VERMHQVQPVWLVRLVVLNAQ